MRRLTAVLLVTLAAVSCQDIPGPQIASDGPQTEIVDAAHNEGRDGFYFLPPLVDDPGATGTFDAAFLPFLAVEICEWDGAACVEPLVARFTSETGSGSETLRIGDDDNHYIVNWHTSDSDLDSEKDYRIRVLAGSVELGHADVDVVSSGKELKDVDTDAFVALKNGRTLPIKFRIDVSLEGLDIVDVGGGTFASADRVITVDIPNGGLTGIGLLTIVPGQLDLPPPPGAYTTVIGPYSIELTGGELTDAATVTIAGSIESLHLPEVWAFHSDSWVFHQPTALGPGFVSVNVDEFSTFEVWEPVLLGNPPSSVLVPLSDNSQWEDSRDHAIGLFSTLPDGSKDVECSLGCGGWLNDFTVNRLQSPTPTTITILPGPPSQDMRVTTICSGDGCEGLRGFGGEIASRDQHGLGWFSARVRVEAHAGSRYSFFLFNGQDGENQNPDDEATIELDYNGANWFFDFTVFRRLSFSALGGGNRGTVYSCSTELPPDHFSNRWFTLTIHRADDEIEVFVDNVRMGSTSEACITTSAPVLPRGRMNIIMNAWAPREGRFADVPNTTEAAEYEIGWIAVSSEPLSDVEVTVNVTGSGSDPDGFIVTLDGVDSKSVDANSSVVFGKLFGQRTLEVGNLGTGCTVLGSNPRIIDVPAATSVSIIFDIDCQSVVGGTYFDRNNGVIGTTFLFDPTVFGSSIDISGPSGWNSGNTLQIFSAQPPGVAENRAFWWDLGVPPVTGNYSADGSGEFVIDAASVLDAPLITDLSAGSNAVTMEWEAPAESQSFLVRVNAVPFPGFVEQEFMVSGSARTASLSGLALVAEQEYQAVVFAINSDLVTPGELPSQFNVSAHGLTFVLPGTPVEEAFEDFRVYNGHSYAITTEALTWADAQALAESFGGNLVTVNDVAENDFIAGTYHTAGDGASNCGFRDFPDGCKILWIGLFEVGGVEGTWAWVSGESVSFFDNWEAGEPNDAGVEDCAIYGNVEKGRWNDTSCTKLFTGLVEFASDPRN